MRKKLEESGLTVNAIAGTHVVSLGLDLVKAKRKGCLGFAIQREDHSENERYWMRGMKTFAATDPGLGPGGDASSHEHPFQSFQWADYSAKPDHDYTYLVVPLYGTPAKLKDGDGVSVRVRTEEESGDRHCVFFNRGAVASQAYARQFLNQPPDKVAGGAAYRWLSRGLLEALLAFIARAQGTGDSILGAVYEFQWPAALEALKKAAGEGVNVQVIYDGIPGASGPKAKNEAAIKAADMQALCQGRTQGKLMHNKFFVLIKNQKPAAVWTGSTNLTENGIFGHSNCGHIINDGKVAQQYYEYWKTLKGDPAPKDIINWDNTQNAAPPNPWNQDETVVFSPRSSLKVLQWYADVAGAGHKPLFMTFAFGMHKFFQQVYEQPDGVLRFALMEKEGNGAGLAKGKIDITRIRKLENVVVAVAKNITLNQFDRWLKERAQLTKEANVKYIHTKYMLMDPLGDAPVVVTGSANFSEASTNSNEENMVVIRNNERVADIYLGEFMRLYSHYAFREVVSFKTKDGKPEDWKPQYLNPKDAWQAEGYFIPGNQRFLRREYFAG